jgi:hypothetical protein
VHGGWGVLVSFVHVRMSVRIECMSVLLESNIRKMSSTNEGNLLVCVSLLCLKCECVKHILGKFLRGCWMMGCPWPVLLFGYVCVL